MLAISMSVLVCLLAVFQLAAADLHSSTPIAVEVSPLKAQHIGRKLLCVCAQVFQPVCGSDGRVYGNACEAGCAGVPVVRSLSQEFTTGSRCGAPSSSGPQAPRPTFPYIGRSGIVNEAGCSCRKVPGFARGAGGQLQPVQDTVCWGNCGH